MESAATERNINIRATEEKRGKTCDEKWYHFIARNSRARAFAAYTRVTFDDIFAIRAAEYFEKRYWLLHFIPRILQQNARLPAANVTCRSLKARFIKFCSTAQTSAWQYTRVRSHLAPPSSARCFVQQRRNGRSFSFLFADAKRITSRFKSTSMARLKLPRKYPWKRLLIPARDARNLLEIVKYSLSRLRVLLFQFNYTLRTTVSLIMTSNNQANTVRDIKYDP